MELTEFFNMPCKKRKAYIKHHILNFNNIDEINSAFNKDGNVRNNIIKLFDLQSDKITSIGIDKFDCKSTITYNPKELLISINIVVCVKNKVYKLPIYFTISNKNNFTVSVIKCHNTCLYEEKCDLWDKRENYNNINFDFPDNIKEKIFGDDPTNNTNIIDKFIIFVLNLTPEIQYVEDYCFSNNYITSYNKYNKKKFVYGNCIMRGPLFTNMVNFVHNYGNYIKDNINNITLCSSDINWDVMHMCWSYMCAFINKGTSLFVNCKIDPKIYGELTSLFYVYGYKITDNLYKFINNDLINIYKEIIADNRQQFSTVIGQMCKEYYNMITQLQDTISKKYGIDKKYFTLCSKFKDFNLISEYNSWDTMWDLPVPEEYSDIYC